MDRQLEIRFKEYMKGFALIGVIKRHKCAEIFFEFLISMAGKNSGVDYIKSAVKIGIQGTL